MAITKEAGFRRMEQNMMDVIKESEIKLGYACTPLQLFYPCASLNHMFHTELNEVEMEQYLKEYASYAAERLGEIGISRNQDRFGLTVPEDGVKYVHEHIPGSEFLEELIRTSSSHGCTLDMVIEIFYAASHSAKCIEMDHEEFDYCLYFEDGKPDDYLYCIREEGHHVTYHRFKKEDYEELGFSEKGDA